MTESGGHGPGRAPALGDAPTSEDPAPEPAEADQAGTEPAEADQAGTEPARGAESERELEPPRG